MASSLANRPRPRGPESASEPLTRSALDWLERFVSRTAADAEQAALLRVALDEGRDQAATAGHLLMAELPLLAYEAAGGRGEPPLALAGCCLSVYLGADILDDLADHGVPARWATRGADQATLAAATLLSPFALAALEEVDAPAETRVELFGGLARCQRSMAAGQLGDLLFDTRNDVSLADGLAAVFGKAGAGLAWYAEAGALLGGAPRGARAAYAAYGRHLAVSCQLVSDCANVFATPGPEAPDLRAGKRSLPVYYALAALDPARRAELVAHLAARTPERLRAAQALLLHAGGLEYGVLAAEAHRRSALGALARTGAQGPAADRLRRLAEDLAVLRQAR